MPTVDILCLANARKRSGRCVAGLRLDGGGWVRPVGDGPDGSLTFLQHLLTDGTRARLLDVVRLPLAEPCPQPHQPENWRLGSPPWRLVARPAGDAGLCVLRKCLARGRWLLGSHGDRIPADEFEADPATASLALIRPEAVAWRSSVGMGGGRKLRALFTFAGVRYNLSVSDPLWEQRFVALPTGDWGNEHAGLDPYDDLLFTVSLGEPFHGDCYKLVAAVVVLPPAWRRLV